MEAGIYPTSGDMEWKNGYDWFIDRPYIFDFDELKIHLALKISRSIISQVIFVIASIKRFY